MYATALFPLFLNIADRKCVVIGGDAEALKKITALQVAGADVHLIFDGSLPAGIHQPVVHVQRRYKSGDLAGARLVFSTMRDDDLNQRVELEAQQIGAFLNVADVPQHCDFYMSGVIRRGPITVAISSGGSSPALVALLRERIETHLPPALGELGRALASRRHELLARFPDFIERARRVKTALHLLLRQIDTQSEVNVTQAVQAITTCRQRQCSGDERCCLQAEITEA